MAQNDAIPRLVGRGHSSTALHHGEDKGQTRTVKGPNPHNNNPRIERGKTLWGTRPGVDYLFSARLSDKTPVDTNSSSLRTDYQDSHMYTVPLIPFHVCIVSKEGRKTERCVSRIEYTFRHFLYGKCHCGLHVSNGILIK